MQKERVSLAEGLSWSALLLAALVVRIRGAWNGLMLDEIWSLQLARAARSPLAVFTTQHNSNNHYLNTLWLYFAAERGNWPGYRIPSVIAGVAAVGVAGLIGRRSTRSAAFFAMTLTGFSYVEVLYSDEARGYATLVLFALLYFYALQLFLERPDWRIAGMVGMTAILGLAAQLIFLNAFAAGVIWSSSVLWKSRWSKAVCARDLLICHLPPLVFLGWLYWVDLRWLAPVLGTSTTLWRCFTTALAWIVPPLASGWCNVAALFVSVAGILTGCWVLWRRERSALLFYLSVIFVIPLLLALLSHSPFLYVRHFLLSITFALMAISFVLAAIFERGIWGRIAAIFLVACYLVVNGRYLAILLREGHGDYASALRYLVENSIDYPITVGGDQDFRIGTVLDFYAKEGLQGRRIWYYRQGKWPPPSGPEWVIANREAYEEPVPRAREITIEPSLRWEFVKTIPAAPLSAQHWFIYHRIEP